MAQATWLHVIRNLQEEVFPENHAASSQFARRGSSVNCARSRTEFLMRHSIFLFM